MTFKTGMNFQPNQSDDCGSLNRVRPNGASHTDLKHTALSAESEITNPRYLNSIASSGIVLDVHRGGLLLHSPLLICDIHSARACLQSNR